jgi:diphosphoinositol-polyphosphate diphosphatase
MGESHKQYGVLPYFKKSGKIRIILITGRNSNLWIVPKGNQMPHKTKRESAIREAYEESGLTGLLDGDRIFCIPIISHGKKTDLTLYPMRVNIPLLKKWPERNQRKRIEVSCKRARSLVTWPELGDCIKLWEKSF